MEPGLACPTFPQSASVPIVHHFTHNLSQASTVRQSVNQLTAERFCMKPLLEKGPEKALVRWRKKCSTSSSGHGVSRRSLMLGTAGVIAAPYVIRDAIAQGKAVNVGVILPLSGANAQSGVNSRNGIELVADEINAAGGINRWAEPASISS